jgi:dihydroorotase
MTSLLLANGRIVNEGRIDEADLLIVDDRLARIGAGTVPARTRVVDLDGLHVLPGLIDDQVHFREPGLTHKATIASESLAAICGGVTSYLDMPNNSPPCIDGAGLAAKKAIAACTSFANYGFYLGATNTNIEAIRTATRAQACGIKVFMGASTGDMLVDDERALERIFAEATLPIATHCEDTPLIRAAEARAREKYGDDVPMAEHPNIRSAEACYKSSALAVGLAKRHGARLHVLHLTTARELELFARGPIERKRITAEVCAHHLWFDDSQYASLGAKIKCNPAIKTANDRARLVAAVNDDVIDVIATDHAPHTAEEKARPYFEAPSGLPLVQHLLNMLLDQHHAGVFSLETIATKTAHNPARLFGVKERGFIREGYFADLVVVDLNATTTVSDAQIRYKCAWSPFAGHTFRSGIVMTVLGGHVVFERGVVVPRPMGAELVFHD